MHDQPEDTWGKICLKSSSSTWGFSLLSLPIRLCPTPLDKQGCILRCFLPKELAQLKIRRLRPSPWPFLPGHGHTVSCVWVTHVTDTLCEICVQNWSQGMLHDYITAPPKAVTAMISMELGSPRTHNTFWLHVGCFWKLLSILEATRAPSSCSSNYWLNGTLVPCLPREPALRQGGVAYSPA